MTMRSVLFAAIAAFTFIAPALSEDKAPQAVAAPRFQSDVEIQVNGLVCDFCARAIDKTLRRKAEVASVHVDLSEKIVSVAFKPGQSLDDQALRKLVKNAGYSVVEIRRRKGSP